MKTKLIIILVLSMLTACVGGAIQPDGSIALVAPMPLVQIDPALAATVPYLLPIIIGAEIAGEAQEVAAQQCVDRGGTPNLVLIVDRIGAGYQPGCQPHIVTDGTPDKIRSRIQAAQAVEGKTPQRCVSRGDDRFLVFPANYRGSSHRYKSVGFVFNSTNPAQSTFIPLAQKPENATLNGFTEGDKPVSDPQCQVAWAFMNELIANLKLDPIWQSTLTP